MAVEIPRVLTDPEQGVTLRNGASVRLRAIRPDDGPRLMALCHRLSPRTVYERFFSFRRLLPEEAHALANVDYRHPLAIVDVGQGVRFLWKEPPEGEESLVHGAWAQPMAQGHQARPVVGADRAEANGGDVAQCHWFTLARSRCPAARPWAPHRRPARRPRPP